MAKKNRSCKSKKSTLKNRNRKGKGGIFSCMGSSRIPISTRSAPSGIYRKNSQKSSSSSDGYGQYVITDTDIIKKQTPFSSHYPGHKNKSRKNKKNVNTI